MSKSKWTLQGIDTGANAIVLEWEKWIKTIIEVEDVLFHHNSAVLLPNKPTAGTSSDQGSSDVVLAENGLSFGSGQDGVTGLQVIRAAFKYVEKNSNKLLVLAGHTDTSGEVKYNFDLSEERANSVLYLLTNQRDEWAQTCTDKHQVEDYQQILKHYASLLLWPCDPGKIDNAYGPRTRKAVQRFQEAYNSSRESLELNGADIPVKAPSGGKLDKETWKAIFNLYRWEIAVATIGTIDSAGLSEFEEKLNWVDDDKKIIPCGESFPIDAAEKDNYVSQRNRRVELLFLGAESDPSVDFPPTGNTVFTEDDVPLYKRARWKSEYITPEEVEFIPWMDIQTVDDLGLRVGNATITLIFASKIKPQEKVTTDATGYKRIFAVPVGKIDVQKDDGSLAKMIHGGELKDAVLDPRSSMQGIVSIVVKEATEEQKKERTAYRRTYGRLDVHPADPEVDDTQEELKGRGDETRKPRASFRYAVDNLMMVAGLTDKLVVRHEKLVRDVLGTWLKDYYPTAGARGFIVFYLFYSGSLESGSWKLLVLSSGGNVLGRFDVVKTLAGLQGAFSIFETAHSTTFLDMTYRRYSIGVKGKEKNPPLHDIVDPKDKDTLLGIIGANSGKVHIVINGQAAGNYYQNTLHGGTGFLEEYGGTSKVNGHVHARNKAVVKEHARWYKIYIHTYVKNVEACKDEPALRKLGPPMSQYTYKTPPGASDSQRRELWDATETGFANLQAWKAISAKIDEINGVRSGGPFLLGKFKLAPKINEYANIEVEYNLTLDANGKFLQKTDKKIVFKMEGPFNKGQKVSSKRIVGGIEHEIDLETGDQVTKVSVTIGKKYGLELSTDGKIKVKAGLLSADADPVEKSFGIGVTLPIPGIGEVYFGIGFQGVRTDTILAYVSGAPGFFQRRPIYELLAPTTKWNDLTWDEQKHLETLGFREADGLGQSFWDTKHTRLISEFPESARKSGHDLTAKQKIALVHLGFTFADYRVYMKRISLDAKTKLGAGLTA